MDAQHRSLHFELDILPVNGRNYYEKPSELVIKDRVNKREIRSVAIHEKTKRHKLLQNLKSLNRLIIIKEKSHENIQIFDF
ncbi:hypothetical protein Glove_8g23 [Diversispora epigaea]|uniref:Uncharacterized protein n=1 Tax=Diversispora epigaea TaxID=1348612 RepID=A0A397JZ35_9GLOM|nr:hypothetical protein Glove_8g23 [Diversispora epigaea]